MKAREEARAGSDRIEARRALRDSILAAEREKARGMAEDRAARDRREDEERGRLAELEVLRRRRGQHSTVDFRFSRLHEGGAVQVSRAEVEGPSRLVPDPIETAAETKAR